jgi:hypothetical protein
MEICPHAYEQMAIRLTENEMTLVESRAKAAWESRDTPSLAIVAHELTGQRATDNAGVTSNGNLIIAIVKQGTLTTVFLRRDTQEVKAGRLKCASLAWMIPKRPTGPKARKYLNRRW